MRCREPSRRLWLRCICMHTTPALNSRAEQVALSRISSGHAAYPVSSQRQSHVQRGPRSHRVTGHRR
eukprot:1236541-Prymnesium_polylepis.1